MGSASAGMLTGCRSEDGVRQAGGRRAAPRGVLGEVGRDPKVKGGLSEHIYLHHLPNHLQNGHKGFKRLCTHDGQEDTSV